MGGRDWGDWVSNWYGEMAGRWTDRIGELQLELQGKGNRLMLLERFEIHPGDGGFFGPAPPLVGGSATNVRGPGAVPRNILLTGVES